MLIVFLVVVALAAVVMLFTARAGDSSSDWSLPRGAWLVVPAVVLQILWRQWWSSTSGAIQSDLVWMLPASYVPIFVFLALNRSAAWAWVVGVGTLLNVVVMVANGGAMPAPAPLAIGAPSNISVQGWLAPRSKDRVIDTSISTIRLAPLADRYVITLPGGEQRIASLGDFIALAGGILAVAGAMGLRWPKKLTVPKDNNGDVPRRRSNLRILG